MRVEKRNHLKIKINQNFNCTLNQKTPKPKEPTMPHRASEAHISINKITILSNYLRHIFTTVNDYICWHSK